MRASSFGVLCAFLSAIPPISLACSSDDPAGGGGGDDVYEPPGNGAPMGESEACQAIIGAEDAKRSALACGPVTRPPCPTYLQKGNPVCSQYDQGTVQACVAYIGAHASCDALTKKKCVVKVLAGSAPNGCPVVDAGGDAAEDAAGDAAEDAAEDSAADAGSDAASDAPTEAASDATSDATPEAAGD